MDAIQAIKDSVKIAKDIGNVELRSQLLDVQSELNELKEKVNDLTSENRELRGQLDLKESLSFDNSLGAYFLILKDGASDGPYCSKCYDVSRNLVRMLKHGSTRFHCPACQNFTN